MKKIFLIGILAFLLQTAFSKEVIKPNLNRRINDNIISLIQGYKSNCTFSSSKSESAFYSLFTDLAFIYNDYLPDNSQQEVTPRQYYKIIQNHETKSDFTVSFSEIQFIDSLKFLANNIFISKVRIDKKINFTNWNGFTYPEQNFELLIEVLINTDNPDKIDCRINKITALNPIMDYSILKVNMKNINPDCNQIIADGKLLELNKKEKEMLFFLPAISDPEKSLTLESYDGYLNITPDMSANPDRNLHFVNILHYSNDAGLTFQYNIFPGYSLTATPEIRATLQNIKMSNTGYGFGMEFNKKILNSGKINFYLNVGLGFEKNNIKFSGNYSNEGYEYETADSDGDSYLRRVELKGYNERVNLNFVNLPVGLKINYFMQNRISFESTIGGKLHYLMNKNYTSSVQEAIYKGYYEQFDQVLLDRYYDFGTYQIPEQSKILSLPVLNYGIFANAGVNYKLNQKLFVSLKLGYYYALSNMANKKTNFVLSETKDDLKSIIYSYDFIRKNNLNINLGLNYKF